MFAGLELWEGSTMTIHRGPLLTALRDATAQVHQALEAITPLSRTPLTAPDYLEHLVVTASVQWPLERALFAAHDWVALGLADAAARQRNAALEADLRVLGVPPERVLPAKALPDVSALGPAVGCLYVLEGSTLGGQLLCRRVEAALGPEVPLTYLRGAGPRTGERWMVFCEFAEALAGKTPGLLEGAVRGAMGTFTALHEQARAGLRFPPAHRMHSS